MATNKDIVESGYAEALLGVMYRPCSAPWSATSRAGPKPTGSPSAGTFVGPQAVLDGVFMRLGEVGDEYTVVADQFVADGDTVVVLGRYTWKHKDSGAACSR